MTMDTHDERPICPLCKSRSTRPRPGYQHVVPGDWSLYQCSDCGTSFIHPMPDSETLSGYYDVDYYGQGGGKFVGSVEAIVRFFRYLRARAVRRLIPQGRVLDVGCGRGLMLKFLKSWGYRVDGIELDTVAGDRASRNLNQQIFRTLEEPTQRRSDPYQAICFWHSLEHMPEPGKALEMADRLLAPGGLLVISAPHMESLQSRLSGPSWLHLDLPRHVIHFDMKRLAAFFQTRGYRVIHHRHFSQEYNVIDSLCYPYAMLGFGRRFPFDLIQGARRHKDCITSNPLRKIIGLSLLLHLTVIAFCSASLFSLLKSGSTVTLFLKKTG
ncbi:MAG: class I SAM-dependent methyltransferase [Deltaproteobacteria bacterium]|nr:class I SAM-dependent methyltransferase [Deltaproteobacteria bacterium]